MSSTVFAAGEYVGERNAFNRFHGKGTYKYTNGNVYEGEWVDGRKSGEGTQTWPSGEKYSGSWSNNREHGEGTKQWPNGDRYSGEWLQGKMSGNGSFNWANGDVYTGAFIADQPHGKGVFTQANGTKYEGNWTNGKRNGEFTVTLKDGTVSRGTWKSGVAPSNATVVLAGGELYSGPVSGGFLPNGKGTCTKAGKPSTCEYKAGKKVAVVAAVPKSAPKPAPKPAPVVKAPAEPKADAKPFDGGAAAAPVVAEAPKPKDPRTHRGERADGSQFFFKHSWGGVSEGSTELSVEKDINEFGAMQIKASGGGFDIVFTVDEYIGPATYKLAYFKASIQKAGESTVYRTSASEPGTLTVLEESNGKLIGTFSFTGYPYGNVGSDKRQVTEGEFAIPLK